MMVAAPPAAALRPEFFGPAPGGGDRTGWQRHWRLAGAAIPPDPWPGSAPPRTASDRDSHEGLALVAAQLQPPPPLTLVPMQALAAVPACAGDPAAAAARRPPVAQEARQPVRIHVEASAEGVNIWLAVDGTPPQVALRLAAALLRIRRDSAALPRIASVVGNGSTLFGAAPWTHHIEET